MPSLRVRLCMHPTPQPPGVPGSRLLANCQHLSAGPGVCIDAMVVGKLAQLVQHSLRVCVCGVVVVVCVCVWWGPLLFYGQAQGMVLPGVVWAAESGGRGARPASAERMRPLQQGRGPRQPLPALVPARCSWSAHSG